MKKIVRLKKMLSVLLVLCMALSYLPVSALAAAGCEHHTHDDQCGYVEAVEGTSCDHVCTESCKTKAVTNCVHNHEAEVCTYTPAVEASPCDYAHGEGCNHVNAQAEISCTCGAEPQHTAECAQLTDEAECNCAMPVTHIEGCNPQAAVAEACDHVHGDCGYREAAEESWSCGHVCTQESGCIQMECAHVCSAGACYTEAVEGSDCTYVCEICKAAQEPPAVLTITGWSWVDEYEILSTDGTYATLPNAADWETLKSVLPASITADVNGEEAEIPVQWACETFPTEGMGKGTYELKAILPEGYALGEDVAVLTLEVDLGVADDVDDAVDSGIIDSGNCSKTSNDNVTWAQYEDGTLTISGTGDMEDYSFYYTSADFPWKKNIQNIQNVVIEDGVTSIGNNAFRNCTSLTSVTIPSSVTSIGDFAFRNCTSLTSVTIQGNETSIGNSAFYECSSLTDVTIQGSVKTIGSNAFERCSKLTSIAIPNGVTSIGDYAFQNCSGLTSVTFQGDETSIGIGVFRNCSSLTSVTIQGSVSSIGNFAFQYCSGLTSVTIPNSVTSIGTYAFEKCSSLTSVTIPDSVTSIGSGAFSGCSDLTSISIPDSVTSIDSNAFSGCSSLTSVTIPDGVTSIDTSAFSGCSSLTSITIPASVTSIYNYAFERCSSLTSITIPASVTSIYNYAFSGCTSLKSVTYLGTTDCKLPSVNDEIFVFEGCYLDSIYVPANYSGNTFCGVYVTRLYTITVDNTITNGTVSATVNGTAASLAANGETVTLTVTPSKGYKLDTLTVKKANDEEVTAKKGEDGKYTFNMPDSNVVITANFKLCNPHDWRYTANGDTITASCACGADDGGSLTIARPVHTVYGDNKAANATISNNDLAGVTTLPDIQYQKQTGTDTWGDATTTAPTNAGTYKASITVGNATAYVKYTVEKKELTIDRATATDRTYERGNNTVTITGVVDSGRVGSDDIGVTATKGTLSSANAGTYTQVTLTDAQLTGDAKDNYKLPDTLTVSTNVTIAPKAMFPEHGVVATFGATLLPYVENAANVPTVTVKDGDHTLVNGTDYHVTYTDKQGNPVASPNAVGEYQMYVIGSAGLSGDQSGNYRGDFSTSFQISSAPIVENQIENLPDPKDVEPDDKDTIDAYEKAKTAYDALTDADKNLIGKDAKEKLEQVGKALTAYDIVKGHKTNYVKGSGKTLTFTANGCFGKFTGVEVDGKLIDEKYYTAESGSTIITLKNSFLESLSTGKHTIQVNYSDGTTGGEEYFRITVNNGSPMTGDDSHLMLFSGIMVTSLLGMAMLLLLRPRKKGRFQR